MSGWAIAAQEGAKLGAQILGLRANRKEGASNRDLTKAMFQADHRLQKQAFAFNKRLALEQLKRSTMAYRVRDARAAGIHPLVAAGVSMQPLSPVSSGGTGIPTFTGSAPGDAIAAMGQTVSDWIARATDKESLAQNRALTRRMEAEATLAEQQAADSLVARTVDRANVTQDGVPPGHKLNEPQFTSQARVLGIPLKSGFSSDAQTFEDRYGEIGGSLMGLTNIPLDILTTLYHFLEQLGSESGKGTYVPETVFNIK